MGSIPLPALAIQTPQQPDLLQKYGQLMALKNMQQQSQLQQQEAPLRLQALQQGVQSGQQDFQIKQQALKDQQAMTTAMQSWDGKDINQLIPLVVKNGASATAVMGLKSKVLEQQQTYSKIAADDATTGAKKLETMKGNNDLIAGALAPLIDPKQTPDAQLPQAVLSTAQDLQQKGLLDPQHLQTAQQIAQSGDPNQIRQQLAILQKSYMGMSAQMDQAQKTAQINSENSTTAKNQAETDYYKQNGGAPGVSTETVELNSYLKNNPGKTAQDFVVWKAQHSPSVIVQNMSGGSAPSGGGPIDWGKVAQKYGMTPQAFDQQAEKFSSTGQLPPIGRSPNAIAMNRDIMNRAAELHPDASLAANSAEYKANADSLKKLQASYDTVTAFENTANKNITMLEGLAQKVPDLGVKFANVPIRLLSGSMIGSENMAAFKTALAPVQAESAKILNSANLSGQLSDSSRHELQDIVDGNLPYKSLVASLNVLQQDFENRKGSTADQIKEIQRRLGAKPSTSAPSGGQPNVGDTKKFPNGKTGTWDGTGWVAQ